MPSLTKIQTGFLEPQGAFTLDPGTASAPGLKFSDSAATGMFSPSTGVLAFSTGSTQNALRILANGNIGIGTTNPTSLLHVSKTEDSQRRSFNVNSSGVATIAFGDNSNASNLILENISSVTTTGHGNNIRWQFSQNNPYSTTPINAGFISIIKSESWTSVASTNNSHMILGTCTSGNDSEKVRITSSGNVGIGTTNPQSKIHINAETGTSQSGASVGVIGRRLSFNNSSSDTYGALNIGDWNTLGQRVIVSISSRQIGDPGGQYYENGGEIATFRFTGTGTDSATGMVAAEIAASSSGSGFGNSATSPSDLIFKVSGTGGSRSIPVERFRIAGSGNVGIGSTNPSSKLAVNGTITESTNGTNYWPVVTQQDIGTAPNQVPINGYLGSLAFEDNDSVSIGLLNVTGNVGIGTSNTNNRIFQIYGDNVRSMIRDSTATSTFGDCALEFGNLNHYPTAFISHAWDGTNGQLSFHTRLGGDEYQRVTINSSGNVGIGTTNPTSKLDVRGGFYQGDGQRVIRNGVNFYEVYPIIQVYADNGNPAKTLLTINGWTNEFSTLFITIEVWASYAINGTATYARGGALAHYNGTRSISALTAITSFGGLGVGTISWTGPSTAGSTGASLIYTGPTSNYTTSHIKITANSRDGANVSFSADYA